MGCSSTATVWIDSTSSSDQDRYLCSVNNYIQPPSYCELGEKQWGVTYTPDSVCALEGSSVDLSCSYKHPGGLRVIKSFWFVNKNEVGPVVLQEDNQYKGRVQYYQNQCKTSINGVRASDAQTYWFRFITDDVNGINSIGSGVRLSVTGLKIEVLNTQGGGKQLICSSTCTLTNPTYIWYRNEQPVSEQNRAVLYLRNRTVDAGSYSCAVKEHKEIRSAAVCQNYIITNISSQHSGLYYCTALNQLGQHSSAPARLDVFYPPRPPSLSEFNGFNGSITLVCVSDSNPASSYTCPFVDEPASAPVYETVSDLAMTSRPCTGAASSDEVQYSTIQFKQSRPQEEPLCPTVHQTLAFNKEEEVEYATVNKARAETARYEESPVYSMVQNSA
ncbi:uncharacterized protein LOC125804988 [Astyanax mexicanus]|uniref:uncharacterized protein LOC125804988 n=1 Tax=Astyanax mexicanus TaxID=7994 RepID=UPI0020CB1514|nr:uncharacterized protein LOC125804988 [Astyanax mexicanus]